MPPPRITSILKTKALDYSVTGLKTFDLSQLILNDIPEVELPNNLRLGHLVERIVSKLIDSSRNYSILHESLQIIEDNKTIGELDFILTNKATNELLHLEIAYKFYLYDPSLSDESLTNWIGPNRRDSLQEKLKKLKNHQFPLLHHPVTSSALNNLNISNINQALCLMASLFVPYNMDKELLAAYEPYIKGFYLTVDSFQKQDHLNKMYYIPLKSEWGIDPASHNNWKTYDHIQEKIQSITKEKRSLLCWQKQGESYTQFFIVWW